MCVCVGRVFVYMCVWGGVCVCVLCVRVCPLLLLDTLTLFCCEFRMTEILINDNEYIPYFDP